MKQLTSRILDETFYLLVHDSTLQGAISTLTGVHDSTLQGAISTLTGPSDWKWLSRITEL